MSKGELIPHKFRRERGRRYGDVAPSRLENMPSVCAFQCSAHHDDQQNVLEVVPEAQSVAAEQGKVSLQKLGMKQRLKSNFRLNAQTNTQTHAQAPGQPRSRRVNCGWERKQTADSLCLT